MVTERVTEQKLRRETCASCAATCATYTGWGHTQLKVHLARLVELEYLVVHRGGRGQSFVYELVYEGQGEDGQPFLCGLIDVATLGKEHAYDGNRSGSRAGWPGVGRPLVGGRSGAGRVNGNGDSPHPPAEIRVQPEKDAATARPVAVEAVASYRRG